jgi:putative two-component system response regulator
LADKRQLLVVDDIDINRMIIVELFSDKYDVIEASDGLQAIEILNSGKYDIAIVLLDLMMPILDGFGVLRDMNETRVIDRIPVIMVTGDVDDDNALEGYSLGASDVMHKPFNAAIVRQRVENVIELYAYKDHLEDKLVEQKEELERQEGKLKKMNLSLVDTLSATVEFRSLESGKHILRTRLFMKFFLKKIAAKYGLTDEQIELISYASALHDVGKIAIPDAVLQKPGRLTDEEFEIMKSHTVKGSEILMKLDMFEDEDYFQYCYDICRSHHERWDGRGYPDGLKGDDIPIWAQAASIVDVYDALTSKRVYKDAFTHEESIRMIVNGECGSFNPYLLEVLVRLASELKDFAQGVGD